MPVVPIDKATRAAIEKAQAGEPYPEDRSVYPKKKEPTEFQKRAAMRADRLFSAMGGMDPKTGESNRDMAGSDRYREAFFGSTYRYPAFEDMGKLQQALSMAGNEKEKSAAKFKAEADAFTKAWDERVAASKAAHSNEKP